MNDSTRTIVRVLGLIALCYVLFQFGNSNVSLTDPDDVFYADTAKEMLAHHSWLTPIMFGQPQFEKPPLYYWLLMFAFQLLGVTAGAARLVGVLIAMGSVVGTYFCMRRLAAERVALIGALVLATSIWWIGLARVVLTDLLFSVLIMFALYAFLFWYRDRKSVWLWLFGALTGLAALAKSPIGLLLSLIIIVIFLVLERDTESLKRFLLAPWWILCLAIALPWYIWAVMVYGNQFVWEFFVHDHWHRLLMAEHKEFNRWYFYLVAVGFGFIPWTGLAPFLRQAFGQHRRLARFFVIWLVVIGLFFTLAQSKLTTYVSPLYPALALLVAMGITSDRSQRWVRYLSAGLLFVLAGGLGAGAWIASQKLPDLASGALASFGSLAIVILIASVFMAMNRKMESVATAVAGIALFSILAASTVFGRLDNGLTQSNLLPIMARMNYAGQPVLSSKLYARGICFYTDCPVSVVSEAKEPYWSPHPIPILSDDSTVTAFLSSRDTLLCVLSGGDLNRIVRLLPEDHRLDTLAVDMGKSVVVSLRK